MKGRRKSTPQKQAISCKRITQKHLNTSNMIVPRKITPVSSLLNNSQNHNSYSGISLFESRCNNIHGKYLEKENIEPTDLNTINSSCITIEHPQEPKKAMNNECVLDCVEVVGSALEDCTTADKYGTTGLKELNNRDAQSRRTIHDDSLNTDQSNFQNSHSLLGTTVDTNRCIDAFTDATVLLRELSYGYNKLRVKYDRLYSSNNQRRKELDRLTKKADQQADRIAKVVESLAVIQEENSRLKAQHSVFLLYKKEVGKYVDSFKSSLELKEKEIRSVQEHNERLEEEILSKGYENEGLKGSVNEGRLKIEYLEEKNRNMKNQVGGLHKRICEVESSIASEYYRNIIENISKLVGNKEICDTAMKVVKSRLNGINNKMYEMAQVQAVLNCLLFSQIKENIYLKDCINKGRTILNKILDTVSHSKAKVIETRGLVSNLVFYVESSWKAGREEVEGLYASLAVAGLNKLKNIVKSTEMIALKARHCKTVGLSTILLKKHYAGLMANQRMKFEEQKMRYEQIIADLKSRNEKGSEESDIWDIFQH